MPYHFETLAIHAGQVPDPATQSFAVPIYRTTAFAFRDSQHGADLFGLKVPGNIYARLMNPTNDVLEQRLAALDGGKAALTFASGTAAIYFTITNIAALGDEIQHPTIDGKVKLTNPEGTPAELADLKASYDHLCEMRDEIINLGIIPPVTDWKLLNPNL